MGLIDEKEAIYECDNICTAVVSEDESRKCKTCPQIICIDCYDDNPLCEICQDLAVDEL